MNINRRTGQGRPSHAEGNRALELFTDRYEFTRLFAESLNELPREKILFFYGDGGNGKSLLLKFLRQNCCKQFREDIWQQLRTKPHAELATYIEESADDWEFTPVPVVHHDFGQKPIGDDRPQDPFYGLLMLRRDLAQKARELKYRLNFPLYDFACFWYLHSQGKSAEEIKQLFPAEAAELIAAFVDVALPSVGTISKAVLDAIDRFSGSERQVRLYRQRLNLTEAQVDEIRALDPESELIDKLPCLLAADLNAAIAQLEAPKRIVLFFDTHEAFWGEQRNLVGSRFFVRDEWLRYLLAELELTAGIVVVVAGREEPRWAEATKSAIPSEFLDIRRVEHLSTADAREYLQRAGLQDTALTEAVITYASVQPDEVQPFLLALCVDVVEAKARGVDLTPGDFKTVAEADKKPKELIERLLKYVDEEIADAVHALSAARAFDRELYFEVGEALHFQATEASFRVLTRFSFVWQDERRGENWYHIHDLLRRLDDEGGNETTRRAHAVLEQRYRERGELAEAVYHANRLDWQRGVEEWVEVFNSALELSRYQQCRTLLEVRSELLIQSDFQLGGVSRSEGDYFAQLARYAEAKQEYLEAISAYERILTLAPDDIYALNNKGLVLRSLGNLQTQRAEHADALGSYQEAVTAYERALTLAPDYVFALNNKGNALLSLGNLQTQRAQHADALGSYQEAVTAYERALTLAPDYVFALNNKGLALLSLGDLQTQRAEHADALKSYQEAITAYNRALTLAPDYVFALNNKGLALLSLGDLQTQRAEHADALKSYQEAIAAYNRALTLAPDYIVILNNKGNALTKLGDLQTQRAEHADALGSYQEAVTAYERALTLAPDYVFALNNKGNALLSLGNLQTQRAQHADALGSYQEAVTAYERALTLAPDYVFALNNTGNALLSLGDLQTQRAEHADALGSYQEAVTAYNRALTLAPDYINALNNKGTALLSLGDLQTQRAEHADALGSYQEAVTAYNRALTLAPDNINALKNKGTALAKLGDLQTQRAQHADALGSYQEAVTAYNRALTLAPDSIYTLNNKGSVLLSLGNLQAELSQGQEAVESWQAALAMFTRSQEIAPGDERIRNRRNQLQEFLKDLGEDPPSN